jgi:alanyl-tRNA synthetase
MYTHIMLKSAILREDFVTFFRSNQHKWIKPSLVYNNDPTLLFVNSGMCQFKKVFLGEEDAKHDKIANWQICIRAGGKHNDLDDVGKDSTHLTSFVMLGNWSMNSYWKDEAIELALTFLLSQGLDKSRMYATYFEGNDNIPTDIESRDIWSKHIDPSHVVEGNFKDNFWMMSEIGPCGSCTEIHYDLVGDRSVPHMVNKDDPHVIEIWNIVFMEYNATKIDDNITYVPLKKKFVDTGCGSERLAMILDNKQSVYELDFFSKLFSYVHIMGNTSYYVNSYDENIVNKTNIAYRIFVDHIRTVVVALFQGVTFDSHGKEFVLRKIFRRLLFNYYIYLNDCHVKCVSEHHIMPALITEILNYYLFKKHNAQSLRNIMATEEKMVIGNIYRLHLLNNELKNETCDVKYKTLLNNLCGLDKEILDVVDKLTFDLVSV